MTTGAKGPKGVVVTLNEQEMLTAAYRASDHCVDVIRNNRQNRNGESNVELWRRIVESKMSELAVARYLNEYPTGLFGGIGAVDVGLHHEVKHTEQQAGALIVYRHAKEHLVYWLAVGSRGRYEIKGFKYGVYAKTLKYWNDQLPRPAYAVPQSDLISPEKYDAWLMAWHEASR